MHTRRERFDRVTHSTRFNAGLWFDKFIEGQEHANEKDSEGRAHGGVARTSGRGRAGDAEDERGTYRKNLVEATALTPAPELYERFFWRWKEALGALGAKAPVETRTLAADARIIVGLGAESASEVSVTLHRVYGVPFIPGSALKGLVARYARTELDDAEWGAEGRAYAAVFGTQASAGYITFHDALYIPAGPSRPPLAADVMTVHHPGYYQGGEPPADWDDPRPVPFLSVVGSFLLAISGEPGTQAWVSKTVSVLCEALRDYGVGAKTSSGYGRAGLKPAPMSERERRRAEEERARGNADRQEQEVSRLVEEIKTIKATDKEAKRQLKKIADDRVLRGALTEEQKRRLARALRDRVQELQLNVSASEWFPKVLRMAGD